MSTPETPPPPTTPRYPDLLAYCTAILNTGDSRLKCELTHEAWRFFQSNELPIGDQTTRPIISDNPVRPDNLVVVHFTQIQSKVKGDSMENNKLRMIHQQAHIESYAVDLSIDIILRFANYICADGTYLPREFFGDWLLVADDEARHFSTWEQRLIDLNSHYGAFPTHDALWESALLTKDDLLARLAVVHLVHEAHGLDCGDRLLNSFLGMKDKKSADFFREITRDEVTHVAAGFRWYNHVAERMVAKGKFENGQDYSKSEDEIHDERRENIRKRLSLETKSQDNNNTSTTTDGGKDIVGDGNGEEKKEQIPVLTMDQMILKIDAEEQIALEKLYRDPKLQGKAICQLCPDCVFNPVFHFHHLVKENFHGAPRPPFNHELRLQAGMTPEWYEPLAKIKKEGEKLNIKQLMAQRKAKLALAKQQESEKTHVPETQGDANGDANGDAKKAE